MTCEKFYGAALTKLKQTESQLLEMVRTYSEITCQSGQLKPIVYFCSRIKSPESVLQKCKIRGFDANVSAALDNLFDLVGIRIICAFASDVYRLAGWLREQPGVKVVEEKDYYAFPKPNGYRSYHTLLKVRSTGMRAEIQLRTIATDFWATLEHQLKYKKELPDEKMIRDELKRCADEIASVDLSMQTIREIIHESVSLAEQGGSHNDRKGISEKAQEVADCRCGLSCHRGSGLLICDQGEKARQAPRAAKAQETAQVERRSLKETVSASGKIVSAKNKEVNTTLSGIKVKEVKVKVGDTVEAGDVICVFDTTDLELDLADAQATLKASGGKTAVDLASAQRGVSEAQTMGEIDTARANADESDAYNDYLKAKTDEEEAKSEYLEAQQAVIDKNGEWEAAKKRMEEAEDEMAKAKGKADGLSAAAGKADGFATEFSNTVNELASIIPEEKKVDDVKSFLYIENKDMGSFSASQFVNDSADDELKNRVETYLGTLRGLQESYFAAKKDKNAYDAANAEYQAAQAAYQTAQQEVSSWETKYNSAKNSESSYKNAYEQAVSSSDSKYDTYEQKVRSKDDTVRNSASTVSGKEDALTNSQLNASTAQLSDKKTVRQLEEKIESCTVTAPIGGVVTSVNVAEGDSFSGTTVAVIENIASFKVEANIDEYDIPKIKEGQSVVIKTNGTGDAELNGTVEEIAPRANSSDSNSSVTYKITVSVDTPGEELRMDMTAKLSIVIESREDVLTVPYDAVQEADDGTYYVQLAGEDSGTGGQSGQGANRAGTQTGQDIGEEKEQAGQNAGETTGQPPTGTGQGPGSQGMFPGSGSLPDGAAAGVTTAGRRITVEKGIESDYYIEVVSDELTEGMEVIVPASEESGTDARGMIDMQGPMGGF